MIRRFYCCPSLLKKPFKIFVKSFFFMVKTSSKKSFNFLKYVGYRTIILIYLYSILFLVILIFGEREYLNQFFKDLFTIVKARSLYTVPI